jgi:hypothetical protein
VKTKTKTNDMVAPCKNCKRLIPVQLRNINDKLYWFYCNSCDQTSCPATTFESAVKSWNELQTTRRQL